MNFEPIAIVGRSCLLPGAPDPDRLWSNVLAARCSITSAPARADGRPQFPGGPGGYLDGFDELFDPTGFRIGRERIDGLDRTFRWVLHCAREALRGSGAETRPESSLRTAGLVLGTLAYPSSAAARFGDQVWLEAQPADVRRALGAAPGVRPDPRNRFFAGLLAHLSAEALGLGGRAFALDAACASGLYAIKLACDRLHDRGADLMLAGAVSGAERLLVHDGFRALGALSPSGRSRPFHRDADGLVPAEGAGFVALMRLADAMACDAPVYGVIRGIGWSCNGRGRGLLVPSVEGQVRAMQAAYRAARLDPRTVSLLECHATGTAVGDACEADSTARVFADAADVPIGSIKSNLGHPLAAAGVAGLLKVLGALEAGVRPPTLGAEEPAESLSGGPLRLVAEPEEWPGPRRAAVSAFGFGGTNAHLIVDESPGSGARGAVPAAPTPRPERGRAIAVVALGCRGTGIAGLDDVRRRLTVGPDPDPDRAAPDHLDVPVAQLAFPPGDLGQAVPHQLLLLEAVRDALGGLTLPRDRTMVLIGSGAVLDPARFGILGRTAERLAAAGLGADPDCELRTDVRDGSESALTAAAVVGSMPNIVANRVNTQFDLAGPGYAVFAEESSGLVALDLAIRALRAGDADAAVVGAVDAAGDQPHRAALADLGLDRGPADAAVVLVVKPLADAERDADQILSVLDDDSETTPELLVGDVGDDSDVGDSAHDRAFDPAERFGTPHAATGLLAVLVAVLALRHRFVPRTGGPADPAPGLRAAEVLSNPLGAAAHRLTVRAGSPAPQAALPGPRLHVYSGADRAEALAALSRNRESSAGPARLVLLSTSDAEHRRAAESARRWLTRGGEQPAGVAYRDGRIGGDTAFVFTNGSAAYPGMGRELLLAHPGTTAGVGPAERRDDALSLIARTTALAALHARLSRDLLRIEPAAALGYSSGEATAFAALGAWNDFADLVEDCRRSEVFGAEITGAHRALHRAWGRPAGSAADWVAYAVSADAGQVRAAVAGQETVHLMAVNAPGSCVIGGEPGACADVLARLGCGRHPLDYDIVAHVPELEPLRAQLHRLHLRTTTATPGLRYYSSVDGACLHEPDAEQAAAAVARQAVSALDFPAAVERAWADGIRVFIEHGPQGLCTGWIKRILGDRAHVAVALDSPEGGLRHYWTAVAELVAAGVAQVPAAATAVPPGPDGAVPTVRIPLHRPAPRLTLVRPAAAAMARAPRLPRITREDEREYATATTGPDRHRTGIWSSLAGAHREYLAVQAEAHTRFLGHRRTLITGLSAAMAGHPAPTHPAPPPARGPQFSRSDLERLATGRISDLFGPAFAAQDGYRWQTRLPAPPMLLVDRVTGIDAEPAAMGPGTIRTETDVRSDSWYLDSAGLMPPGLMMEAGQADLLLLSWLGADLHVRGERVYRLLGCQVEFHGAPARPGETLRFTIEVEREVELHGVRLFFFRYDCHVGGRLRLTVRNGQAGYFTAQELASSKGVGWDPAKQPPPGEPADCEPADCEPVDCEPVDCARPNATTTRRRFDAAAVRAFAEGRMADCFGPAWSTGPAGRRTDPAGPGRPDPRLRRLHEVTDFDPAGGPWQRGFLRAQTPVSPDDWFFAGHFLNDPCMPGTLMLDGCLQAMGFYLAAVEPAAGRADRCVVPVAGRPFTLVCRGQVTPATRRLAYEVHVIRFRPGPEPVLYADLLCYADGRQAFHAQSVGLHLRERP